MKILIWKRECEDAVNKECARVEDVHNFCAHWNIGGFCETSGFREVRFTDEETKSTIRRVLKDHGIEEEVEMSLEEVLDLTGVGNIRQVDGHSSEIVEI